MITQLIFSTQKNNLSQSLRKLGTSDGLLFHRVVEIKDKDSTQAVAQQQIQLTRSGGDKFVQLAAAGDLKTLADEFHRLNKQSSNSPETQAARAAFQRAKAASEGVNNTQQAVQPSKPLISSSVQKRIGAVVSFDDLNKDPSEILPALQYFKKENIPVDFYPVNTADPKRATGMKNVHANLAKIEELGLNSRKGLHGDLPSSFDPPLPGVRTTSLAWPHNNVAPEGFGKKYMNSQSVARGSGCIPNKWGGFDQHNVKSCSVGNSASQASSLEAAVTNVIRDGGVIGIHLHNKDGLEHLKTQIQRLRGAGVEFMFMEDLAGQGKPLR